MVDSGVWPVGPRNLVQDLEAVGTQQLQSRTGELLAALTPFPVLCGASCVDGAPPCLDEVTWSTLPASILREHWKNLRDSRSHDLTAPGRGGMLLLQPAA